MNDPAPDFEAQGNPQVLVCQIIAGALIGGVSTFLAIVVFMRTSGGKGFTADKPWDIAPPDAIISLLGVAMALVMIVLAPVVAFSMTASFRAKLASGKPINPPFAGMSNEAALRAYYPTRMILQFAMYEGAAFFNLVAFLLEGRLPNLIATLVLLALMSARLPSRSSIDAFVHEQSELLRQERQSA